MNKACLLPWIHEDKLNVFNLCLNTNPKALYYIKERKDQMDCNDWIALSKHQYAKDFINENISSIPIIALEDVKENLSDESDYESDIQKNCFNHENEMHLETLIQTGNFDELLEHARHPKHHDILKKNLDKITADTLIDVLVSNLDWKIDLLMNYHRTESLIRECFYDDLQVEFITNASTEIEFRFIERYLNDEEYYHLISQNPNIFL